MELVRQSYLYHLWSLLCALYQDSALCRALNAAERWCGREIDTSVLLRVTCREGAVARAWQDSFLCRLVSAAVNLPLYLLHRLYLAGQRLFDGSWFANLAFEMGEETAISESWLILLLWIIPMSRWNNAYNLAAFFLLLLFLCVRGTRDASARLDTVSVGFYPLVFLGAVFLAVPLSAFPGLSARFLLYHGICALYVLVTVSAVRDTGDLKRLCAGAGGAVLVSSLYGVYQRIQGVEVNKSYVDLRYSAGMPGRIDSFFDNPNTFAQVLILLLPLLAALFFCAKRWWLRLAAGGVFVLGAAALGMTYSRASWIGIACAAVVFVFLWKPRLIPAFAVVCILCVPLLPSSIWNRILSIGNTADSSTASRKYLYEAGLGVIRTSPVTGAGLGIDAVQAFIKEHHLYHGKFDFVHSHNIYLQVWAETGLLGFLGFFSSMLWNIKNAARQVRRCPDSAARTITAAAAAALCGAMVAGLADYLWNYPRVMSVFWFVFALSLSGVKVCRQETRKAQ